jgi:hypothetical protein
MLTTRDTAQDFFGLPLATSGISDAGHFSGARQSSSAAAK